MADIGKVELKVPARVTISDETAETCLALLKMYCRDKRGGDAVKKCHENCKGCAFFSWEGYFCNFLEITIPQGEF